MDVKTIAVAILGGAFDHNELGDNDIVCVPGALEELQQKHVTGSDDVQLNLIERSHFDRVTAERDALQLRLNAVEEENDRLRADAERYRWMKANVRNGSFGTDTGWLDDDTENWDCDLDIKRGVLKLDWKMEKRP
jgi:hypothetical protein